MFDKCYGKLNNNYPNSVEELNFSAHGAFIKNIPSQSTLDIHYANYFKDNNIYSRAETIDEILYRKNTAFLRLSMISSHLGMSSLSTSSILEIGFGQGYLLNELCLVSSNAVGVDFTVRNLDPSLSHLSKYCFEDNPSDFIAKAIESGSKYDVIVATHVLEHSPDPNLLLGNLKLLLNDHGILCLEIPNDFSPLQEFHSVNKNISSEYWVSPPDHLSYWNKSNFKEFVSLHNIEIFDAFGDYPIEHLLMHDYFNYNLNKKIGRDAHLLRCKTFNYLFSNSTRDDLLCLLRSLYLCDFSRSFTYLLRNSES